MYIYADFNGEEEVVYALYTDRADRILWTREEHLAFPPVDIKNTQRQIAGYFKNFKQAKFMQRENFSGTFAFPDGENPSSTAIFNMIQNEDGIWQVAFMPIQ